MCSPRYIHLLTAAAILFSQIVAGIHMAGHVHVAGPLSSISSAQVSEWSAHPADLTDAEHRALHAQVLQVRQASSSPDSSQGPASLDQSCVIYHVYAGSQCAAAGHAVLRGTTPVALLQRDLPAPVLLGAFPEHNAIRGPPALS